MFVKLSTLALLLPFASALSVNSISGWANGQTVTVSWTAATSDPGAFSIELVNTAFNNEYAIANNIPTANGQYTFELPQVPEGAGYTINFIATNNVNQVYASSNSFNVAAASTSVASSASAASTTASTPSSTGTASVPSVTGTVPVSSGKSSSTGTSSASSSTPSNMSSGAASFKLAGIAPAAALILSVVAGAAMVF